MSKFETKIPPPIVALISGLIISSSSAFITPFGFFGHKFFALIFLILCFTLLIMSIKKFHREETTINPLKPEQASKLLTTGTYAFSRNPMYLGLTGILIGIFLFLGSWFGIVIIPIFVIYITKYQIKPEEYTMNKKFGGQYQSYCNKVRRWI